MCEQCITDPLFPEFIAHQLDRAFEDKDLHVAATVLDSLDSALEWALENGDKVEYTPEQADKMREMIERLKALRENGSDEDTEAFEQEVHEFLSSFIAKPEDVIGSSNPFSVPTQDTVEKDQAAFPDESLADRFIRGCQHLWYYHETRPDLYREVLGQDFLNNIHDRMEDYARIAMKQIPAFGTVLLPIHDEAAAEALALLMATTFLEGLMAGYYTGAAGQDCFLWQSHQLGPIGRMDTDTPSDEKVEKIMDILSENKENNTDD